LAGRRHLGTGSSRCRYESDFDAREVAARTDDKVHGAGRTDQGEVLLGRPGFGPRKEAEKNCHRKEQESLEPDRHPAPPFSIQGNWHDHGLLTISV
jgi:hypothetical protein